MHYIYKNHSPKMLRKFLLAALLLTLAVHIHATECADRIFLQPHIRFTLCQNYSNYNEIRAKHYEWRVAVLEKWWATAVPANKRGKLQFHIQVMDHLLTFNHLQIERFGDSCAISVSGFVSLEQLAGYMFYTTISGFSNFTFNWYAPPANTDSLRTAREFQVAQIKRPSLVPYTAKATTLWKGGNYSLVCLHDSLSYRCGKILLPVQPFSSLPFQIKDRWIFFEPDHFYVFCNCELITETSVSESFQRSEDYRVNVDEDNIRIGNGSEKHYYIYNYAENKFTEVDRSDEGR
jgi:hypothetical protein